MPTQVTFHSFSLNFALFRDINRSWKVHFLTFAWRNARRTPARSLGTVLSVALTLVAFLVLRSVSTAWTRQVDETPNNRVVSRHKIGWNQTLPVHYVEEVRQIPGVQHAMGGRWAGLRHPDERVERFETMAVHAATFIAMHYEIVAPEADKRAFLEDRRGALVSKELATKNGWHLGDIVHLKGTYLPGDWEFTVRCIYESSRHGFAQRSLWFHYEYMNEQTTGKERNRVGVISAEIVDPSQGAELARAVDARFEEQDDQTFTQEDQALNASFIGMYGALLHAIDTVSLLVLGIVILIVGNTIVMSVRERIPEYGTLRAMGFSPRLLTQLIVGEATVLATLGGLVGVALSFVLIKTYLGLYLEEAMGVSQVAVTWPLAFSCLSASAVLGAFAAIFPAYRVNKLEVTTALRDVG